MTSLVYHWGKKSLPKELMGGKGFYLNEMSRRGYPVPPGFTLSTDAFHEWQKAGGITRSLEEQVRSALQEVEKQTESLFGSEPRPLLVSVRSGAVVSMPGMMDTVLNVGATDRTISALAELYNPNFAYGSYRRFMHDYMKTIFGQEVDIDHLAKIINRPASQHWLREINEERYGSSGAECPNWLFLLSEWVENGGQDIATSDLAIEAYLDATSIALGHSKGIQFAGSKVYEGTPTADNPRVKQGVITEVTEDMMSIIWDLDGMETTEAIPITKLAWLRRYGKRQINFLPTIMDDALQYSNERDQRHDFVAGTLRARRKLGIIPAEPEEQLFEAVDAVFNSWNSERARLYREETGISDDLGTAVNIQQMVFGNLSDYSGTAVLYSSDPRTAMAGICGEFIWKAQGEELVSGKTTPLKITELKTARPELWRGLQEIATQLEREEKAIQDIEVTWEEKSATAGDKTVRPYVLQTRKAKVPAGIQAMFFLREYEQGRITQQELMQDIDADALFTMAEKKVIAAHEMEQLAEKVATRGEANLDDIISGRIAFSLEEIKQLKAKYNDAPVIYCAPYTTTNDLPMLQAADAILTISGGAYSHAGIVALNLKKVCITGCRTAQIDIIRDIEGQDEKKSLYFPAVDRHSQSGDMITLNGYTGEVYFGTIATEVESNRDVIERLAEVAQEMAKDHPCIYEVQSLDDFTTYNIPPDAVVRYAIDFDCAESTGVITDKTTQLSRSDVKNILKQKARRLYSKFKEQHKLSILYRNGLFDTKLRQHGIDPWDIQVLFIRYFIERLGDIETIDILFENSGSTENAGEKPPQELLQTRLSMRLQQKYNFLPATTFQDHLVLYPWAVPESYLAAVAGGHTR